MPTFSAGVAWEIRTAGSTNNGGGFDAAYGGSDQSQSNSGTARTDLVIGDVAAPAAPALATGAGGSLSAGTYQVKLTYYNSNTDTETDPTAASSIVAAANDKITVTSPAASEGATHYRVYFTVAGGATFRFQTTVVVGTNYIQSTNPAAGNSPGSTNYLQYYASPGNPFAATDKGNVMKVTSGAGFTLARVEARDFTSTSKRLYCVTNSSSRLGTAGSTGGNGTIGGAVASPTDLGGGQIAPGNIVWCKSGTYSFSGVLSPGTIASTGSLPVKWIGYQTTRGDYGAKPVWQAGGTFTNLVDCALAPHMTFDFIEFDGANTVRRGVLSNGYAGIILIDCKVHRFTSFGVSLDSTPMLIRVEVTACSSSGFFTNEGAVDVSNDAYLLGCNIHDNTCVGIRAGAGVTVDRCLILDNTGATTDGIQDRSTTNLALKVINCTIKGNGRRGIYIVPTAAQNQVIIVNTLMTDNVGAGLFAGTTLGQALVYNCAEYNNGTAFDPTLFGDVRNFVTLTADPYLNAAGGDYSLNGVAGGGLDCLGTAIPGDFAGLATTIGYPDIGAVQTLGSPAGVGNTIAFVGGG